MIDKLMAIDVLAKAMVADSLGGDERKIIRTLRDRNWPWSPRGEVRWRAMQSRFGWNQQRMDRARRRLASFGKRHA